LRHVRCSPCQPAHGQPTHGQPTSARSMPPPAGT